MDRLSFSSTNSQSGVCGRRIWIIVVVLLVLVVVVVATLSIVLPKKKGSPDSKLECLAVTEDVLRFDCHPDRPISKQACINRGCCYNPSSDLKVTDEDLKSSSFLGTPSCFFPLHYEGYRVTKSETKGNMMKAELKRITPSGFPDDVKKLALTVTPIDDYRLRIKIEDANFRRYVPEVPVLDYKIKKDREEKYNVEFSDNNGLLKVTRNSTKETIFSTELSRLVFSNQFLQLSTKIPSKFIYGLGEQKEGILKSTGWARYTLFNQGDLPVPNRNLYGSHPFYMVMESDGQSSGLFLLNSNAIDYFLQPTPAVTIRAVGGILDFYLLLGPSPGDVVSQYTTLFGRPNFPPRWSLGFQLCKYGYFSLNKTKEILNRNLEADIPIDVQWHDIDYMKHYLDFTYDPIRFEGLPEFVEDLHAHGRHYIAMISPGVSNIEENNTYPAYDEGKRLDLFIKDTNGKYIEGKVWNENFTVFPDFSNPSTAEYWKQRFVEFHSELKFDGVWIDMNEPLNFLNGSSEGCPDTKFDNPSYLPGRPFPLNTLTLCMSARHNKTVHYNEHNLVAYREAKATHRAMSDITGKRPFIISRASFAGQGVYSGHWSGDITSDWADMKYTIPAMLAFSLYGMPMTGSDICGFRQNTTEELCARWQALGAFYPLSRNHNDYDTVEQDPAAMGPTVVNSTKKALKIRYYLLPYLYTLFYRNHVYGETVARPLFFEFPLDKNTYGIEDEFLWGPGLLIMPALEQGITIIKPYVPKGVWYDVNTGESTSSKGERFELNAELTDINVFVRGGYVLPAQEPKETVTEMSEKSSYDFLVALDSEGKAQGELFNDDGESIDTYKKGAYNLIKIAAEKNVLNFTIVQNGGKGDMELRFIRVYGVKASPYNVTINGDPMEYTLKNNELRINGTGVSLLTNLKVEWK